MTFLIVYLRQIGLTIQEIFVIHTITPTLQILGSIALSVVVDKFGHSKLILICNLLLSGISVVCILLVPPLYTESCQPLNMTFRCYKNNKSWLSENRVYNVSIIKNKTEFCEVVSLNTFGYYCENHANGTCEIESSLNRTLVPIIEVPQNLQEDNKQISFPIASGSKMNAIDQLCSDNFNGSYQMTCSVDKECKEQATNRTVIIAIYNAILLVILATYMSIFRFFDITAVQLVKEHNVDYGLLRVWTSVGFLCGPFVAGLLVQMSSESSSHPKYEAFLYFYAILCFLAALVVLKVDVRSCDQGREMLKKSVALFKSPDIAIFFVVLFLTGTSWGFDHTYKNWFLAEIGTEAYMLGIINSSQSVYALPFLLKSKWLVGKIGKRNMFVISLVGYSLKFLSYSYLETSWPALIIEVITAFTYQLHWVAVIQFCIRFTPVGLSATTNCLSGSIHYTIGKLNESLK